MVTRTIPAGEFKRSALALLDEFAETGEELVVTKRGKPVARVAPLAKTQRGKRKLHRPSLGHMVEWMGDIESPLDVEWGTLDDWEEQNREAARRLLGCDHGHEDDPSRRVQSKVPGLTR